MMFLVRISGLVIKVSIDDDAVVFGNTFYICNIFEFYTLFGYYPDLNKPKQTIC